MFHYSREREKGKEHRVEEGCEGIAVLREMVGGGGMVALQNDLRPVTLRLLEMVIWDADESKFSDDCILVLRSN